MRVRAPVAEFLFVSSLLAASAMDGSPEEAGPRINVLRIEPRGSDVLIRFHLEGALNPELARRIEAGLETTIRYDIRLYRQFRWWFDSFVEGRTYRVTVTFDPVTREYVISETMDGKPLRRSTTRDFSIVAQTLANGENLLVFRVAESKPHRNLYVSMRATFDSGYLFAFIPVDTHTPWKKSRRFDIRERARENPERTPEAP
ncbi:MAG TPA: DUF4390 domain-containing protein [Thermoanaerobaculia bacterium]|jgi:hypothetical protein